MVTIWRGTARRLVTAVAAIASGGATMAPSAKAAAHVMPGMSAWAATATAPAETMTRPTASELMAPRFARRFWMGV